MFLLLPGFMQNKRKQRTASKTNDTAIFCTSKKHWYIGSDWSLASSSTATEWLLQ